MKYIITAGADNNRTKYQTNKFNEAIDMIESLEERDADENCFLSGNYGILNTRTGKHVRIY